MTEVHFSLDELLCKSSLTLEPVDGLKASVGVNGIPTSPVTDASGWIFTKRCTNNNALEVKAPLNERSMSRTEVEVAKKKKKGQSSCK